jgi:hypothetical protein
MSMIQAIKRPWSELKRPWIRFPRVLALYGVTGIIGAAGLTFLHIMYPDVSMTSPATGEKSELQQSIPPVVVPEVIPEDLSKRLISALPNLGNEWTSKEAGKWNEVIAGKETNKDSGVSDLFSSNGLDSKSLKSPSLERVNLKDKSFLSSLYSLPIMDGRGKIIGILGSDQLQAIRDAKDTKYIFAHSSDPEVTDVSESLTTFFPRAYLLNMKVIAYKLPDTSVAGKPIYFLLNTAK